MFSDKLFSSNRSLRRKSTLGFETIGQWTDAKQFFYLHVKQCYSFNRSTKPLKNDQFSILVFYGLEIDPVCFFCVSRLSDRWILKRMVENNFWMYDIQSNNYWYKYQSFTVEFYIDRSIFQGAGLIRDTIWRINKSRRGTILVPRRRFSIPTKNGRVSDRGWHSVSLLELRGNRLCIRPTIENRFRRHGVARVPAEWLKKAETFFSGHRINSPRETNGLWTPNSLFPRKREKRERKKLLGRE